MRSHRKPLGLTLAASLLALAAIAPAATADVSSAKGKRICKEAGEASAAGVSARVNARDIRSTETSLIYRVRLTDAAGERTNVICTVDKASGEAGLTPDE